MKHKVLAYCRVSGENSLLSSIERQKILLDELAEKNNWTLELIEETGAISGRNALRKGYVKLKNKIAKNNYYAVVIPAFERLNRNTKEALAFKDLIVKRKTKLFDLDNEVPLGRPEDDFFYLIRSGISEFESKKSGQRQRIAKKFKRKDAEFCGGHPPYGFDKIYAYSKFQNESEFKVYKLQFNIHETRIKRIIKYLREKRNVSYRKIANYLNCNNVLSKTGKSWSAQTIKQTLQQLEYAVF